MRDNDTSGPAFPSTESHPSYGVRGTDGMSLRDWFAGMALSGLSANEAMDDSGYNLIADYAYKQADAMLKARKTTGLLDAWLQKAACRKRIEDWALANGLDDMRARKSLSRAGIDSIEKITLANLTGIKHCGEKTIRTIMDWKDTLDAGKE